MPTKKKPKGITATKSLKLSKELYDKVEELAKEMGLINPRNKAGNRTKMIELAIRCVKVFGRHYHIGEMPYPQNIADYLVRKAQEGDEEAFELWQYLKSWSTEITMKETLAEKTCKTGDSWIV